MIFYYSSLAAILLISFFVLRKDFSCKKISNQFIIAGFILGLILFAGGLLTGDVSIEYFEKVVLNTFISLAVSFLIWQFGFWPAGDAKFFMLISFLLPLYYYKNFYLQFFPSFALLFNIFVAFLIFALFKSAIFASWRFFCFIKAEKNLRRTFAGYFETSKRKIVETLRDKKAIVRIIRRSIYQVALSLSFYIFVSKFILKIPINLVSAIFFMIIFKSIWASVNLYMQKYSCEKIKVDDLKAGDNLDKSQFLQSEKGRQLIRELGKLRPEGLEEFQVEILKKYFSENKIKETVIHRSIPFSGWILIGAVLTVIFSGIINFNF